MILRLGVDEIVDLGTTVGVVAGSGDVERLLQKMTSQLKHR